MSYDFAADKNHHPAWANYDKGPQDLTFGTDLISDPSDDSDTDVTEGLSPGVDIGSQDS